MLRCGYISNENTHTFVLADRMVIHPQMAMLRCQVLPTASLISQWQARYALRQTHSWFHYWLDLDIRSRFPDATTSAYVVHGIHEHDATRSSWSLLLYGGIHVWSAAGEFLHTHNTRQRKGLIVCSSCSTICTLARCHILPIFQHSNGHYNPSLHRINYAKN